jgi:hypothetical protein
MWALPTSRSSVSAPPRSHFAATKVIRSGSETIGLRVTVRDEMNHHDSSREALALVAGKIAAP